MRRLLIIAALLGGLIASACSSDSTTSSDAKAANEDTATTVAGTKATGDPIAIGFINNEGGAFSVPELRVGNEVGADYVNDTLGGVNGRPIHVERCATD